MVALDAVPLEPHVYRDRVIHLQRSRSALQSESDRPRCTNMQQARRDISVGLGTAESSQQLIATHPKRLVEADPVRAAVKVAAGDRGALRIIRLPLCAKHALVKAVGEAGKGACARTVGADEHPVHLNRAWPADAIIERVSGPQPKAQQECCGSHRPHRCRRGTPRPARRAQSRPRSTAGCPRRSQ